jgi:hypothetical protein
LAEDAASAPLLKRMAGEPPTVQRERFAKELNDPPRAGHVRIKFVLRPEGTGVDTEPAQAKH